MAFGLLPLPLASTAAPSPTLLYDDFSRYPNATVLNGQAPQIGPNWETSGTNIPTTSGGTMVSAGSGYLASGLTTTPRTIAGRWSMTGGSNPAEKLFVISYALNGPPLSLNNLLHLTASAIDWQLDIRLGGSSTFPAIHGGPVIGVWTTPFTNDGSQHNITLCASGTTAVVVGPNGETFAVTDARLAAVIGNEFYYEAQLGTGGTQGRLHIADVNLNFPGTSATTFNPNDKASTIALSNGNRTATCITSGTTPEPQVRCFAPRAPSGGKAHFEFTITAISGADYTYCMGVSALESTQHLLTNYCGFDNKSVGFWLGASNIRVYAGNAVQATIAAISGASVGVSSGDVYAVEVDFDNSKIWICNVTKGSGWNGDVIANQNPATNTGGFNWSAYAGASFFGITADFNVVGDAVTINTGQAAWAKTPSTGFVEWLIPLAPVALASNTVFTAASGSYALTGQSVAFVIKEAAPPGSYTLTGTTAGFRFTHTAASSSYSYSGQTAAFVATNNQVLTAAAGSYSYSGQPAAFVVGNNAVLIAATGSYALTGTAASINYQNTATGGASYTYIGTAANFNATFNFTQITDPGAYALTGSAANLLISDNKVLTAAAGSYALTGQPANLFATANVVLTAAPGSYSYVGVDAAFQTSLNTVLTASSDSYSYIGTAKSFRLTDTADPGSYSYTGLNASFLISDHRVLTAAAGSYTYTGQTAAFLISDNRVLTAAAGSYALTGTAAAFQVGGNFVLAASPGSYTYAGQPATFPATANVTFAADPGAYTYTGQSLALDLTLAANPGAYTYTGTTAAFVVAGGAFTFTCSPGAYNLTGQPAAFIPPPVQAANYTGGLPRRIRKFEKRKERRDEIEELLDLVRKDIPPELAPEPTPTEPSPPPPSLFEMAPQAPALMTAVGLKGSQRAIVKQGIVSEDEDDDEVAIELLLNLLTSDEASP